MECAKAGSPLVILTDDGTIYWPISESMPATGQNQRLMEYAGKRVAAQGKVFERGGSHAIAIEKIEAAPDSDKVRLEGLKGKAGLEAIDVKIGTAEAIYTCPMHPEVQQAQPGKCPKCGMNLEKKG